MITEIGERLVMWWSYWKLSFHIQTTDESILKSFCKIKSVSSVEQHRLDVEGKCICISVDMTLNSLSAHKTLESSLCDSRHRHPSLSPSGSLFIWSVSSYGVRSAGWSNRYSGLLYPEKRVRGHGQEPLREPRWWPLNHGHSHLAKFSRESRTSGSAYGHTHMY